MVSAFLFGIAMFSVPASLTDLVKASLPRPAWGPAIALFTVLFAVGQTMGPLLTGWLADATHSLNLLFSNESKLLRAVRDIGLGIVDRAPPLKNLFIRQAAGLTGEVPRLLKGEAL